MYSNHLKTEQPKTGHIRKPDFFMSSFRMVQPFENRTFSSGIRMVGTTDAYDISTSAVAFKADAFTAE